MQVVIDIEANALFNPSKIWVIVCRDLLTGKHTIFRNVTDDLEEAIRFNEFANSVTLWIGHNWLNYDFPHLKRLTRTKALLNDVFVVNHSIDTLIVSRLVDYPRDGHSVENYGVEFGLEKINWHDYSKYSTSLEEYCIRDVDITYRIYKKYQKYIDNPLHKKAIELEHKFQLIINSIEDYGFKLDINRVQSLLHRVTKELTSLDDKILTAFPPRLKLIREVTPKETKFGTISLSSIPKALRADVADMLPDAPFSYCAWTAFNPSSHKQIISILNQARWLPVVKTKAHIDNERNLNRLKRNRNRTPEIDSEINLLYTDLKKLGEFGWKVNEENLGTLPTSAPQPARQLAKRILYEARRRTLTEWNNLVQDDGRVHGRFQGIGAWTHRMSHQKPNMANITNEFDINGNVKLLGKELRQCWTVPKDKLLVGVDAEGIQLRIFAHLIDDAEFTRALVEGKKDDKTDPHSLNQRVLGSICKSRDASKRFIFAFLLGAGMGKLAEILNCSASEAQEGLNRILQRYEGLAYLKETIIPRDAKKGWFTGLDGRKVRILGDTEGIRRHLAMSGYLQSGEAVVIKTAAISAQPFLHELDSFFVDIIHDEYQVETPNDFRIAKEVAEVLCKSITEAGELLALRCPLAGSYWNDKHKEFTIGKNWYETH